MLKNLFSSLLLYSFKRTFFVLGSLIVIFSIPITLFAIQHQQDLRQRADFEPVVFHTNQTISGADRTKMPSIAGDPALTFQLMEAAGLENQEEGVSIRELAASILNLERDHLIIAVQQLDKVREIPYATIIKQGDTYTVLDGEGTIMDTTEPITSYEQASQLAESLKTRMVNLGSPNMTPLSDSEASTLADYLNNQQFLGAEQDINTAADLLDTSSSAIKSTITSGGKGISSVLNYTKTLQGDGTVEVRLVGGTTKTFTTLADYVEWGNNLKTSIDALDGISLVTGTDILSTDSLTFTSETAAKFFAALKILGRVSFAALIIQTALMPSGYSIYWGCSATDPTKPERIVVNPGEDLTLESAKCETGSVCKITSNTDITCVPEAPTSTPTPTPNNDPLCSSLGQNAYCNPTQCNGTDIAFTQNTIDCSDNSASAGVPQVCCAPVQGPQPQVSCPTSDGSHVCGFYTGTCPDGSTTSDWNQSYSCPAGSYERCLNCPSTNNATTPTCASLGGPSKCVDSSFSSGVESCTTSYNQPGYYNWIKDTPEGHYSDCATGVNDQCAVCQASGNPAAHTLGNAELQVAGDSSPVPTQIPVGQACPQGSTNCQTGSTCILVDKGLGAPASYFCYPSGGSSGAGCVAIGGLCIPPGQKPPTGICPLTATDAPCPGVNGGSSPNICYICAPPTAVPPVTARHADTVQKDTVQGSVIIQDRGSSTHRLRGATITIDSTITVATDSLGEFKKSVPHIDTHTITLSVPAGYQLVTPESPTQTFETTGNTWKNDLRNVNFTVQESLLSPTSLTSPTPICDPNKDGKVDQNDMTILLNEWFGGLTTKTADCNKDGVVNGKDFQILKDEINGVKYN